MKSYTIGISCIGSGVGESVINSCRLSGLPLKTIGLGTNAFAYGAYACDSYDYTPTIYAADFVDKLIQKCLEHQIDFLIPGRDDEAHIYAKNRKQFSDAGIKIIAASEEMIALCRDKERMSHELNPVVDVFVKCYEKGSLKEALDSGEAEFPLIAKPRSGFASMGVEIIRTEEDLVKVTTDHILQELAMPLPSDPNYDFYVKQIAQNKNPQVSEISIQVVLSKEGELLGKMASYNKLNNGVPIEVVPYDDVQVWDVVDKLLPIFKEKGLVGPLNIQGRITGKGLKIFEMNPRFTGITGLRALMGFNEVEACIRNWLDIDDKPNVLRLNNDRFGIRQTADKVLAFSRNKEANELALQVNGRILKPRKSVVITGASGYLGRSLIKALVKENNFDLFAIGRDEQKLKEIFEDAEVKIFNYEALKNGELPVGSIDMVVHAAFARPHCTHEEIAESLAFTNELFFRLAAHQVPSIVNLSSQSVYGQNAEPLWKEDTPVGPRSSYAQAKYASELMLKSIVRLHPHIKAVSLRLAALSGGQEGLIPLDFLSKMVSKALNGEDLNIIGGKQQLEIMDIRDAVGFISKLLTIPDEKWQSVYNIGSGGIYNIVDIAQMVREKVSTFTENPPVELKITPEDISMNFGMDNSSILQTINSEPLHPLSSTIGSLIEHLNYKAK